MLKYIGVCFMCIFFRIRTDKRDKKVIRYTKMKEDGILMKRFSQILAVLLAFLLCLSCAAYAELPESLAGYAGELAGKLAQMAGNRALLTLYSSNAEVMKLADGLAGEWSDVGNVERALTLSVKTDELRSALQPLGDLAGFDPDALFGSRVIDPGSLLANMLNARVSSAWLALSSIVQVSDLRVYEELAGSITAILFDYGSDAPAAIVVSICAAGDGAALATAHFIKLTDEMRTVLDILSSKEAIIGFLSSAVGEDDTVMPTIMSLLDTITIEQLSL